MLDALSLKYFGVVARECSVSRAARLLHSSQSVVSRRIQQLEHEVGARLFERRTSGVTLTTSGRELARYAEEIRRLADEALHVVSQASGVRRRPVRIGFYTPAATLLVSLLRMLRAKHPEVEVTPTEATRAAVLDALRSNKIDLALPGVVPPELLEKFDSVRVPSPEANYVLPNDHHFAHRKRLHLAELTNEKFVSLDNTEFPGYNDLFLAWCRQAGFVPQISTFAHSWIEAIAYVVAGRGITLAPRAAITMQLAETVTLIKFDVHPDWHALWSPDNGNPQLRTVIQLLLEAGLSSWIAIKHTMPALGSSRISARAKAKANSPGDS